MNLSSKKHRIVALLLTCGDYMTSKFISFSLGISVRSVKSYIAELNGEAGLGFHILSKRGAGYKIVIEDAAREREIKAKFLGRPEALPFRLPSWERVEYITKELLAKEMVDIDDILENLHISIHSFHKDLYSVRARFQIFRIRIRSRSNKIFIDGSETDIRLCMREYLYMDDTGDENVDFNFVLASIKEKILSILHANRCSMALSVLNNLAVHVYLGMNRYMRGKKVMLYPYENRWNLINKDDVALKLASELGAALDQLFKISLPREEIFYYALHFKCKLINFENTPGEMESARFCVKEMIEEIQNNFGLNFSEDEKLIEYLNLHIPPMITRIKAHIVFRNFEVTENLIQYLFATKITHSACRIIKKHYGVSPDINEFGYLVLYFQMALMGIMNKNKYKIGILIQRGRAEQLMYFYEINSKFAGERYHFEMIDLSEEAKFKEKSYDLILSTDDLRFCNCQNVYVLDRRHYIEEIDRRLEELDFLYFAREKYFRRENFITNWSAANKAQADKKIFQFLLKNGYLKEHVKEFSEFEYTELGKGLVHLQDTDKIISKTICLVIVLNESIYWNKNPVRIILLTKTKKDTDADLYSLCSVISRWARNDYNIIKLLENKDFESFFADLGK